MISLKSLEGCLDVLDDKQRSQLLSRDVDVCGRDCTVDETVRVLQALLLLVKEFPAEADRICIYLLHRHPIGRGFVGTQLLQGCYGTKEENVDGAEALCRDLCKEVGLFVKRIFSEKEEEEEEVDNKGRVFRESRFILLSNIASTFLNDFDKCYQSKKGKELRHRIDRLKSDGGDVNGVSLFSRYCEKVRALWTEERRFRIQTSSKDMDDLFVLFWEILVRELESILDRFATLSPSTDDTSGKRSTACLCDGFVSSRSSGEIIVSNEEDSCHQTLGQCRNYPTDVKGIVRLAQSCWSLEMSMLPALNYTKDKVNISSEGFSSLKSHFYSDNMENIESRMNFNWRSLFLPFLGDLIDTIDREICFVTSVAIQEEWEQLQMQPIEDRVVVTDSHNFKVLRSVWTLCEASANYLPLAELASLRLAPLRTSFVDRIRGQSIEIQNHLLKIGRLVPHPASVSILYVSLGSIFKWKTILKECHEKLESDELDYVCYELEKVELSLIEQVTLYHQDVIANCILQDDEAHNWESTKPFYENECCSFSIQQWYLHLLALRHDLWSTIPSSTSVQIFTRVLENSLRILVCRYSAIKPSFVRTKQMQADIVAILLCTSHLLEFTSSNILEFYAVTSENIDGSILQRNIHNFCTSLASTLIVVTAPLKALHKVFKKGFLGYNSLNKCQYHWNWLTIGQNAVWRECCHEYNRNTTLSLSINLKLLCNQPTEENWPLLLQVLFDVNHAVARLFLVLPSIAALTDPITSVSSFCDDVTDMFHPYECFKSLMYTLVHLDSNCCAFAEVFLLWMRGNNMQPDFFTNFVNRKNENVIGMDVIFEALGSFIDSVVKALALHLVPFVDLDDDCLRKMWKLVHDGSEFDSYEIVIETIELFLSILPANFAFIPDSLCHLFIKLQELENSSKKNTRYCLPFRFLCAVYGFVLIPNDRRWYFTTTLKPGLVMTTFSQVSKLLLYLGDINPTDLNIPADVLSRLIVLQSSIDKANEYVQDYFALSSKSVHHCNALDNLGVVVNLSRYTKGVEHLRCLQRFLFRFKDWFINSLGQLKSANKSKANLCNSTFNPFETFGSIGDTGYTFDQESLVKEVQFDWERLIKENLFVSKDALSTLLYSRWEFNLEMDLENSNLEHNDQKYVSVLRELFVCRD